MDTNNVISKKKLLSTTLVAVTCCGAFISYEFTQRYGLELSIDMSSSVSSTTQLFFDTGRNFNEQDSKMVRIAGGSGFEHLNFKLPFSRIKQLRFDPATVPGSFVFRKVVIKHTDGSEVMLFSPGDLLSLNQIRTRNESAEGVSFITTPDSIDSSILFRLDKPLGFRAGVPSSLVRIVLLGCSLIGLFAWFAFRNLSRGAEVARALHLRFGRLGNYLSVPDFLELDAPAVWFLLGCVTLFVVGCLANLNGSSIAEYQTIYSDAGTSEVVGEPRGIRSDEWAFHTPAILNQIFRKDALSAQSSSVGGHSVALISNLPVRHVSAFFRPQFWPFFVLSPEYAFAAYWQSKALLLLTGVFLFLLLLSQSTRWSIVGTIWYFLSPHIQWTYSSPNLLPEMVGALCFSIVFFGLIAVASNYRQLATGVVGLSVFALDFALCAYVPGLVPLVWIGVFGALAFLYHDGERIWKKTFVVPRIAALLAVVIVVAAVLFDVLHDAEAAIAAISNTVHPGKRLFSGGYYPIQYLFSDLFALSESENHIPPALLNICEASGFFWIAPAVLFLLPKARSKRATLLFLFCGFFFLLAWCVLPIPTYIGKIFALDRTWTSRCMPALGLANIAIVTVFLGVPRTSPRLKSRPWYATGGLLGTIVVVVSFLLLTNELYKDYFTVTDAIVSGAFVSLLIYFLTHGWSRAFATLLIGSHLFAWGLVNPIERGLGPITSSSLFRFVQGHRDLLNGKWAVFSDSYAAPGFLKAVGCDVYNGEQYQPDFDHFSLFASNGLNVPTLNRLGYLLMEPIFDGSKSSVQLEPNVVLIDWKISPFDPMIRQLGIKYVAFDKKPPADVVSRLAGLQSGPIDGFWLYKFR